MIRPNLRSRMPVQTGWVMLKTPVRLVSMTSRHCCGVILWNGASRVMPALLTSTSRVLAGVILWTGVVRVMPALLTSTSTGPRSASTCLMPAAQAS